MGILYAIFFCNYEIISKQRVKQMNKVVVVILLSFIYKLPHVLAALSTTTPFTLGPGIAADESVPHVPSHEILSNPARWYSHFTANETEAQRGTGLA